MKNKYDSIIFDLDGTLWDACPTTAQAWNNKLIELGLKGDLSGDDVRSVAGQTQDVCIERLVSGQVNLTPELAEALTNAEMEEMKNSGGRLFDGVKEGIELLSQNYSLLIVSNCLEWYLNVFFEKSGLKKFFVDWDCWGSSGIAKSEMIKRIIEKNNLNNSVYIGDTLSDEEAASGAGIDFVHAKYGFGTPKNAQVVARSFGEIVKLFSLWI